MADGVRRVTEVIGVSSESWEAAARSAVETAATSVRDLRIAEVRRHDVTVGDGGVVSLRVRLAISFKFEAGEYHPPASAPGSLFEPEAHLQRHLEVPDAAVVEVAADRQYLEPVEVAEGLRGLLDRPVDRLGDALGGGARDLHGLVNGVAHRPIITATRLSSAATAPAGARGSVLRRPAHGCGPYVMMRFVHSAP